MKFRLLLSGALLLLSLTLNAWATPMSSNSMPENTIRYILKIHLDGKATELPLWVVSHPGGLPYLRVIDLLAANILAPDDIGVRVDDYRFVPVNSLVEFDVELAQEIAYISRKNGNTTTPILTTTDPIIDATGLRETWVELDINNSRKPQLVRALIDGQNHFYLNGTTLKNYHLRTPVNALVWDDEKFYAVNDRKDIKATFNHYQQSLMLHAQTGAFESNQYDADGYSYVQPDSSQSGALLNYSLAGTHSNTQDSISGLIEIGAFRGRGFFSTNHLVRDTSNDTMQSVRLESSLRIDRPEKMQSLILGDTQNAPGSWGRPIRYAGLRWGRNFDTQPGFITFPTITATGTAETQSTVDVYIDNMRRSSKEVQPGPFTITNIPVITGTGDVRIITRDLLGRETSSTLPFYASAKLLKKGLHDYSYELGVLRQNFGLTSNDYGDLFSSATHRYGFANWFTGELRGELRKASGSAGLAANFVWPGYAEFQIAGSASVNDNHQSATRLDFGINRQSPHHSFGASATIFSENFSQLGDNNKPPDKSEARAFVGTSLSSGGSFSLSYIHRDRRAMQDTEFLTLQYSKNVFRNAQFRLSYLEALSNDLSDSITLSLTLPIGDRTSSQISTGHRDKAIRSRLQLQRNLPAGNGYGYRIAAETGKSDFMEAGVNIRGNNGMLSVQAAKIGAYREYRASADGGIAFLQSGGPYLSQRLDQAFAVIKVPKMKDVGIYRENQLIATTDSNGNALVTGLRAYQKNNIMIEDASLPLDVKISSLEQSVVPAFRHGVSLSMEIQRVNWVSFTVVHPDGTALAAATPVTEITSGHKALVVASGRVYVELPPGDMRFTASADQKSCQFDLRVEDKREVLPDLGVIVCE